MPIKRGRKTYCHPSHVLTYLCEKIDHSNDIIVTTHTIVEDLDEDLNIESDSAPLKRGRKVSITYCHPPYVLTHVCELYSSKLDNYMQQFVLHFIYELLS